MLLNGPPDEIPEAPSCFWWRRGRVELHLKRGLTLWILPNLPAMRSPEVVSPVVLKLVQTHSVKAEVRYAELLA